MLSASKILIKRSSVPGSVPLTNQLEFGELALNLADKKIFFRTASNDIASFDQTPYTFLNNLSSTVFKEGNNSVTGIYSQVLGGYNNDVTGSGSVAVNGENNDIDGDFSFIGNGLNNTIGISGEYGAILGGKNNDLNHAESFILGSDIISHSSNFTYVNNLSSTGKIYGDGSSITGIVAGDSEATTLVRQQSANWETAYDIATAYSAASSTFLTSETDSQTLSFNEGTKALSISNGNIVSLSALLDDTGVDTEVRSLTSNWDSTYTTVQSNSSTNWNNSLANQYTHANFLPLTGGSLTGAITTTSTISSSQTVSANGARVITGLPSDSTPVYYITVLTQGDYDAIVSPDPNTLYFIKP